VNCFPSQFSQCCPVMAFDGKQFHELANEWARCSGKNACYITMLDVYHSVYNDPVELESNELCATS